MLCLCWLYADDLAIRPEGLQRMLDALQGFNEIRRHTVMLGLQCWSLSFQEFTYGKKVLDVLLLLDATQGSGASALLWSVTMQSMHR